MDYVKGSGFSCAYTPDLIRDFTCLLSEYREEDVPLFPEIYVVSRPGDVSILAPGTMPMPVGKATMMEGTAETILKACAPLARRGWAIFVEKVGDKEVAYGLFRAQRHSYATSASEALDATGGSFPAILLRNRGHLVVELRNSKQTSFTATFTSAPPAASRFGQDAHALAQAISADLSASEAAEFEPYLRRLLVEQLPHSHGSLIAVHAGPTNGGRAVHFEDGIWLEQKLDIATAHRNAKKEQDAESLAALEAVEALMAGMLSSDGVVVFSPRGEVLAYRVFLKPSADEWTAALQKGGGRRRTFALLEGRIGGDLRAAFFRSQDGETAFVRIKV